MQNEVKACLEFHFMNSLKDTLSTILLDKFFFEDISIIDYHYIGNRLNESFDYFMENEILRMIYGGMEECNGNES